MRKFGWRTTRSHRARSYPYNKQKDGKHLTSPAYLPNRFPVERVAAIFPDLFHRLDPGTYILTCAEIGNRLEDWHLTRLAGRAVRHNHFVVAKSETYIGRDGET